MRSERPTAAILAVCITLGSLAALTAPAWGQPTSDSVAIAQVVERYHRALAEGDSAAALALLAEDVVIVENGRVESRQEYRSHHLSADIAFAQAMKATRSPIRVAVQGDAAWTIATSTTRGTYRGRTVNSTGAELMVLTRRVDGWRIKAIHWSSHNRS